MRLSRRAGQWAPLLIGVAGVLITAVGAREALDSEGPAHVVHVAETAPLIAAPHRVDLVRESAAAAPAPRPTAARTASPTPVATTARPAAAPTPTRATRAAAPTVRITAAARAAVGATFAQRALSLIDYPWEKLPLRIEFAGPRAGYLGMTEVPGNKITIYVRPGESVQKAAVVAAYEMAHVIDVTYLNDAKRKAWLALRGNRTAKWWACDACSESAVGAGDFADVFAYAVVGPYFYVSTLAPAPRRAELALLKAFFPEL